MLKQSVNVIVNIYSTVLVVILSYSCSEPSDLVNFIPFAFAKETSQAQSMGHGS